MDHCIAFFAALLFGFLRAASPAPAFHHDACAQVRDRTLDLNHYAKIASVKARNGSTDFAHISSSLAWIEANDMCDPGSLKQNSLPCVQKIFGALTSYTSAVKMISAFESCSELTSAVQSALNDLHRDMAKCLRSLGGTHEKEHHVREEKLKADERWKEPYLCRYALDRLFSFSVLTARVFAVGDPARHSGGSAQQCV